jgi:hypothetical protein
MVLVVKSRPISELLISNVAEGQLGRPRPQKAAGL